MGTAPIFLAAPIILSLKANIFPFSCLFCGAECQVEENVLLACNTSYCAALLDDTASADSGAQQPAIACSSLISLVYCMQIAAHGKLCAMPIDSHRDSLPLRTGAVEDCCGLCAESTNCNFFWYCEADADR